MHKFPEHKKISTKKKAWTRFDISKIKPLFCQYILLTTQNTIRVLINTEQNNVGLYFRIRIEFSNLKIKKYSKIIFILVVYDEKSI